MRGVEPIDSDNEHSDYEDESSHTRSVKSTANSAALREWLRKGAKAQTTIHDDSEVFTASLILVTVLVASCCGVAAFVLHASVGVTGCLSGLNGCHHKLLLDAAKSVGIGPSLYFTIACGVSGLCCSLILFAPCQGGIARRCKGGGSGATKIVIASGATVNGWIVVLRIILATLYISGGNPLGTEGPIIHMSSALATWLVSKSGKKRRKFLSTFGVIGAAAGLSAGFNVLVTGFVYVIEELMRTLSRKLAIILTFAAGVAFLVTDLLQNVLEHHLPIPHSQLVPRHSIWEELTRTDIQKSLLLCIPIGALSGVAGWVYAECAWGLLTFLNPGKLAITPSRIRQVLLQERCHLAIVGVMIGLLGALAYEVTGMNGVWGTTEDAVPEAFTRGLPWEHLLLLFLTKFIAVILAAAAGGPGGSLIPSLVTGGFLGLTVARMASSNDGVCAACAVIGMGSMFASVMQLPLSGVVLMFELTRANDLLLHIVIANFIASNVVCRLPRGSQSFVHRSLAHDATWLKLDHRDFIETDAQENEADVALFESTLKLWLMNDHERLQVAFDGWRELAWKRKLRRKRHSLMRQTSDDTFPAVISNSPCVAGEEITAQPSKESFRSFTSSSTLSIAEEPHPRSSRNIEILSSPRRASASSSTSIWTYDASSKMAPGNTHGSNYDSGPQRINSKDSFKTPGSASASSRIHDGPQAMLSRDSYGSYESFGFQSAKNSEDLEAAQRKREVWEKVSLMLPSFNWRTWKSLSFAQWAAIAELASNKEARAVDVVCQNHASRQCSDVVLIQSI